MKKTVLVAVVSMLFNVTAAYAQQDHRYNIYVDGIDNESDVKKVSFIIRSLQDGMIISWRDDRSFAKVQSSSPLIWTLIEDALSSEGYHLLDIVTLSGADISGKSAIDPKNSIHFMDPALDAQEYAIQKAQWIKNHSEEYQKLLLPSSSKPEDVKK